MNVVGLKIQEVSLTPSEMQIIQRELVQSVCSCAAVVTAMCISEEGLVVGQKTGWDWVEDLKVRSPGFSQLVKALQEHEDLRC